MTISKQRLHREAVIAVMAVHAHLAVEHLISCNVVQLHSEKVIPGDGIKTERGRASGQLPTHFQSCGLSMESKAAGKDHALY